MSVVDLETHAVETAIEVEGIDVGHARDVVEHGLYLAVEGRGVYFILLGHFGQKQTRVVECRVGDGFDQLVNQKRNDARAGKFDFDHIVCTVNLFPRQRLAASIALLFERGDVVEQTAAECAAEYLLLMSGKGVGATVDQHSHDA